MKKSKVLNILLLAVLLLAACGGEDGKKDPPSAARSAAELEVIDQREIEIEDGRILSLSPDGQWLVVEKEDQLCIYEAKSLAEQACALLEKRVRPMFESVTWSPDSTRVALVDNAIRYMFESDLWTIETESGKLTNLTDDGVTGNLMRPEPEGAEPLVDVAPAWSPDGKRLAFARSRFAKDDWVGTTLYQISADGGDPQEILQVSDEDPLIVWQGLAWSADGKKILYTIANNKPDTPDNGVWIADKDGENPKQLLEPDPEFGPPLLMDVSAKGDQALILYYHALGALGFEPNSSFFYLLDLETGATTPIKQAKGEEVEFFNVSTTTFSPDGSKVLYTYRSVEEEWRLAVRDVDGETEKVLLTSSEPVGMSRELGLGLDWAEDDTIYVTSTFGHSGWLLSVGAE